MPHHSEGIVKKLFLSFIASVLLCFALPGETAAQQKPAAKPKDAQQLEEVVVTATKTEKETADAPATVSVVTSKDIESMNVQSLDEALTFLPGVYATRRGGHEPSVMGTNVLLRGIPDYSRTLVLVDGQTLNDPYIGAVTWELVPPETVERIEVVPGPFSSLYGGSAMGGVINIITKMPAKREFLPKLGYGSFDTKSLGLLYQDRILGRTGVILGYGYKESDGYISDEVVLKAGAGSTGTRVSGWERTTDSFGNTAYKVGDTGRRGWNSHTASAKLVTELSADSRFSFTASYFSYDKEWERFNTYLKNAAGAAVSSGSVTFSDGGDKTIALSESNFLQGPNPKVMYRYSLGYDTKIGKAGSLKAQLGYINIPIYDYIIPLSGATYEKGGPGSRLHRPNSELSGLVQASLPAAEKHFVVAGVTAGQREIETFQYRINDWRNADETGTTENRTAGEDTSYGVFVQDEIYLTDRLTAYLGARYDWWTTEGYIEQVKSPAYRNEYSARSQSHVSPKASLVYRPRESTTLRTSFGQAFHPPVLRDTFGWWTPRTGLVYQPNPDLKPEVVTSWDAGVEQRFDTGTLVRATYYENRLKDLVYRTQTATTQSIANAGKALVKGVELEVRQKINKGLSVFANTTYNNAKITYNPAKPSTEGKRMTRTPQNMFGVGLQGAEGPWSGALTGQYVGKTYANDENLDTVNGVYGSYDPFFVMNAKLAYKVREWITASLAIDNLLDRDYYQSFKAPGRSYFGEVSLRF
jgi:iron complex outermembrane receptor protein